MTNKEKEILDIANNICRNDENDIGGCEDCGANKNGKCQSKYGFIAEALYKAGYRKAESVRKETAEEILQRIYNLFIFAEESEQKIVIDATYICNFAEKEYGIEVEG